MNKPTDDAEAALLFTPAQLRGAIRLNIDGARVPVVSGEFWTAAQRKAASIHEISYRACFKPQLPAYFITRLSQPGDPVYDPFSGRGTTAIEAALHDRKVLANDANPLSAILTLPRLELPDLSAVEQRLGDLRIESQATDDLDLSMFYEQQTLREIVTLRDYLHRRVSAGDEDAVDRWIRMVATNRLTGHSKGFFSVYTLPPNQATSAENQVKINVKLAQRPEYRDTRAIILKKSRQLLGRLNPEQRESLRSAASGAIFLTTHAAATAAIPTDSIQLTVTSPPFLSVVQYSQDNWLRCWFNRLDTVAIAGSLTMARTVEQWDEQMAAVFAELFRITRRGGWIAFEVGEVSKGKIRLEEHVLPIGIKAGFKCIAIMLNQQNFTKTSNIWGIQNNSLGTNTNRIVVFRKSC